MYKAMAGKTLALAALLCSAAVANNIDHAVVVGDSLSDTQNLFALSGGVTPPLGIYYQGRFSDGPVWTDYVAADLGLTVNHATAAAIATGTSGLAGTGFVDNYAVAGAFSGDYTVAGQTVSNANDLFNVMGGGIAVGIPGLQQQMQFYAAGPVDVNAAHVVWAGANDMLFSPFIDPLAPTSVATTLAFAQNVATNVATAAIDLVNAGASNVVVINLPDLGVTPFAQGNTPVNPLLGQQLLAAFGSPAALSAYLTALSQAFNATLAFQLAAAGVDVTLFDVSAALQALLNDPAGNGIANITDPCLQSVTPTVSICDQSAGAYVFWDDVHPTTHVHSILASQLQPVMAAMPEPASLTLLLAGVFMAGWTLRKQARSNIG